MKRVILIAIIAAALTGCESQVAQEQVAVKLPADTQQMPVARPRVNTTAKTPVVRLDTAHQEDMPVVKPLPKVTPK